MRRTAVILGLTAGLLAGCDDGAPPADLAVTTPAPSATAGTLPPAATTPAGSTPPADPGPPPVEDPGGTGTAGPAAAYAALVRDWQTARAQLVAAVSAGRPLTVAEQNALAARFLAAQRRFGTALRSYPWPAPARPAVRRLRAENATQQRPVAAMAAASTKGDFTARFADWGVGTAAENAAVAAVAAALN